jgi:TPR repeat protein
MKKSVVVAVCAVVVSLLVAAGVWLWMSRDGAAPQAPSDAISDPTPGDVKPVVALDAAALAARAERIRKGIERRRHLWREASYIEVRQSALDGDLVAQRRLAEIYEDCTSYDGNLRSSFEMLPQMGATDAADGASVTAIYRDYKRLCPQAKADLNVSPGAADFWLHKSAKAGELTSEMRYFARTVPKLSQGQFEYFLGRIRESGDPDAVFELSLLLPKLDGQWSDPAVAAAFNGPYAEQAWIVAACRAGYDCARGSRLMNVFCLTMFACSPSHYERYLFDPEGAGAPRRPVEQVVALISSRILAPQTK